jgi:alpha-L-rhamnosidase
MKQHHPLLRLGLLVALFFLPLATFSEAISTLRCEYAVTPLFVDTPAPRLTWCYGAAGMQRQNLYQVLVSTDARLKHVVWNSGEVASSDSRAVYAGARLQSFRRYYWRVTGWDEQGHRYQSKVSWFETAMMDKGDWSARWISDGHDSDYEPAPMLRKTFTLDRRHVVSARVYYSGAAYCALKINGQSVDSTLLNPGYTAYDKRNLYSVADVTTLLSKGENVLSAVLGNGFYNEIGKVTVWNFDKARWRGRARMICQLRITFADGSTEQIVSDGSWTTATGPTRVNNIYAGDVYDSRLEPKGWERPGYDDSAWARATVVSAPSPLLVSQKTPPIRVDRELPAVDFASQGDTLFVYDFGKNCSGFCRLAVQGETGTRLTLQHGEIRTGKTSLQMANIACYFKAQPDKEFQTDSYVLDGTPQTLTPQFCYHGFRYVLVRSSRPVRLTRESLTSLFFHTAVEPVGTFECSDTLFNRLGEMAHTSYLSNLMSIPTDCPQREKNGWTADAHMSIDLGLLNYDGLRLYEKWLDDWVDNIRADGRVSGIIPTDTWGYDDWIGPVWDSALFGIPMKLYNYYGDLSAVKKMWPVGERYLRYLQTRENEDRTVTYGIGDWVYYKTQTPTDYTTTCYYYFDNRTMAQMARLLGYDARPYEEKAAYLLDLINRKYFHPDQLTYANGSQAALGVALYLGIVPKAYQQQVADKLSQMITDNGGALDCGMLGSKSIIRMLVKYGHADQAFRIANRTEAPAWGNWVKRGLTSLAETWNISPEFKDASLNHVFLGDINAWMYNDLAGINYDPARPGFEHILLTPHFVQGLDHVKASYRSVRGLIRVEWQRENGSVNMTVEVPANTTATLTVNGTQKELAPGVHHEVY